MSLTSLFQTQALKDDFLFGWELLYKSIERQVKHKSDLIIALTHLILVRTYRMKFLGTGRNKDLPERNTPLVEVLPCDWNADPCNYNLRYIYNRRLYQLLGERSEDCLIVSFFDTKINNVGKVLFDPDTQVRAMGGYLNCIMPSACDIVRRIRHDLIDPVFQGADRQSVGTQTTMLDGDERLPRIPTGRMICTTKQLPKLPLGEGDLDPLGGPIAGNLLVFPERPQQTQSELDLIKCDPAPDHLEPPDM